MYNLSLEFFSAVALLKMTTSNWPNAWRWAFRLISSSSGSSWLSPQWITRVGSPSQYNTKLLKTVFWTASASELFSRAVFKALLYKIVSANTHIEIFYAKTVISNNFISIRDYYVQNVLMLMRVTLFLPISKRKHNYKLKHPTYTWNTPLKSVFPFATNFNLDIAHSIKGDKETSYKTGYKKNFNLMWLQTLLAVTEEFYWYISFNSIDFSLLLNH